jgi:predicted permease
MKWMRETWHRLRAAAHRGDLERGLDEEIRFHIEQQMEKNLRSGMTPDQARRRAFVQFGGVGRIKEGTRDEFRLALLQDSLQDLRHGARALRRTPAFSIFAVLTLALGIGATTAVFTVVENVLLKPWPYPDADALVSLEHASIETGANAPVRMSGSLFSTYTRENRSFEHLGLWSRDTANVAGGVVPEEVASLNVSAGTLPALGVHAAIGREFSATDHTPGSEDTVVLMHGYWQRRFGGDRSVLGRQVMVDARPRTVIGVMPARFRFLNETPDIILPLRFEPSTLTLGGFNFEGIARLAPGVTLEQAHADATRMLPIWLASWPSFPGIDRSEFERARITPLIRPLKQELVGDIGQVLWVLMGTIGIVLFIACANVANLVLVRAEGRHHELATRTALGASRLRLARALLIESLLLGSVSGALGLLLAWAGLQLLVAIGPATLPRLHEIELDPAVLAFTATISVLSALLFGLIPVVRYNSRRIALALRASGRGLSDSRARHRTRHALVVVQVALALILLVGSGLMIRTFLALRAVSPGFTDPHHVQLVRVTIPQAHVGDPARVFRLQRDMADRLGAIPGVTDVSFTGHVPMTAERSRSSISREDATMAEAESPSVLRSFKYVAPGYFRTFGTRLIAGRDFTWTDLEEHRPVVVISENMARELWREPEAALGRRIRDGAGSPWREVVGVTSDVYENGIQQPPPPIVYWPALMETFWGERLYVRRSVTFAIRSSRSGTEGLLTAVRTAIAAVDPDVPLTRVRTLGDVYEHSMATTSFALVMLAIAAAMALFLGIIGIYGVIACAVTQRRREIGIRIALGASSREVKHMFLRHGVMLAAAGVMFGLAGAALLTRLMAALLFGTSQLDPLTYTIVSLVLIGIAALASYVPASAATTVNPVQALRSE